MDEIQLIECKRLDARITRSACIQNVRMATSAADRIVQGCTVVTRIPDSDIHLIKSCLLCDKAYPGGDRLYNQVMDIVKQEVDALTAKVDRLFSREADPELILQKRRESVKLANRAFRARQKRLQ